MTETEARQQKILVALFLLLGKAYNALPAKAREKLTVLECEIAQAWAEKKSPIRVLSRKKESVYSPIAELEEWGGEREYYLVPGDLDLSKVSPTFATVKMPKNDASEAQEREKSRVFTLE